MTSLAGGTSQAAVVFSDDFEDGSLSEYNVFGDTSGNPNEDASIITDSGDPTNEILEVVNFSGTSPTRLNLTSIDTFSVPVDSKITITADYLFGEATNDISSGDNRLLLGLVRDPGAGTDTANRIEFSFIRTGGGSPRVDFVAASNSPFTNLLARTTLTDVDGNVAPADGELVFMLDLFTGDVSASFAGSVVSGTFSNDIIADLGGTDSFRAYIAQDQLGGNIAPVRGTAIDNLSIDVTLIPEPASLALIAIGGMVASRRRHA